MTKQGYHVYQTYLALQRHFTSDYDYFKYNGKINASVNAYNGRSDYFAFEKLSKIIDSKNLVDFFLSHFLDKPNCWIRDMSKSEYEKYSAFMKNFPKQFKEDVDYLAMNHKPHELIQVGAGIPLIHELVIKQKISIETLILMDCFFPFLEQHEKEVNVPVLWPQHLKKVKKYRPFLQQNLDITYYNDIALEAFKG